MKVTLLYIGLAMICLTQIFITPSVEGRAIAKRYAETESLIDIKEITDLLPTLNLQSLFQPLDPVVDILDPIVVNTAS